MLKRLGTSGDDTFVGGRVRAFIEGFGGNDHLTAGTADALLDGGDGDDVINGGAGNDLLLGGDGNDLLFSREGSDTLDGGNGDDYLEMDTLFGGVPLSQSFSAYGGAGNDRFYISFSTTASATIDAGDGDDIVQLASGNGPLILTLGAGKDLILIQGGSYSTYPITVTDFAAGDGGDRIEWTSYFMNFSGSRTLTGNPFGAGLAKAVQSGTSVVISFDPDGPAGFQTFQPVLVLQNTNLSALTAWNLGGMAADGSASAGVTVAGGDTGQFLYGTTGADALTGGAGDDVVFAGLGNDTVYGGGGNDQIDAGPGANYVDGGLDDDVIIGGSGADTLIGGEGNDRITATTGGSDTLDGGNGNDTISLSLKTGETGHVTGGAGNDSVSFVSTAGNATVDLGDGDDRLTLGIFSGNVTATLGAGVDTVGSATASSSTGTTWSGTLSVTDFQAGDGGDILDLMALFTANLSGWSGATNPFGSQARLVQSGADTLLQVDKVAGQNAWRTVIVLQNTVASALTTYNLHGLPADGSAGPGLTLTGTDLGNSIAGTIGADTIDGLGGSDNLTGGAGDDTLYGRDGNDLLDGGLGVDTVYGGTGNDTITVTATGGADTIHGDDGDDRITSAGIGAHLFGDAGNDTIADTGGAAEIDGGDGDDILSATPATAAVTAIRGGAGNDHIAVSAQNAAAFQIDAGDGDDVITIDSHGSVAVTLGAGSDLLDLQIFGSALPNPTITVADFSAGAAGDRLGILTLLDQTNWNFSSDPVAAGYLRLVQSGADTLVQIDRDGPGGPLGFTAAVTLQNVDAAALTRENLGFGTDAAETFQLTHASAGSWKGFAGDDIFYFGAAFTTADAAEGGAGTDSVVLQGDYSQGLLFSQDALTVEGLTLLGHADTSMGGGGVGPFNYVLQLMDGATEGQLLVDASGLDATETLSFDAADESNASFTVRGGAGADDIVTGSGDDTIDGGAGADIMAGGSGNDIYYVDTAGDQVIELDGDGTDKVVTDLAAYTLGTALENLTGTATGGQTLTGNALANDIEGGAGGDVIEGGIGNDRLVGGAGSDIVSGGEGNDFIVYRAAPGSGDVDTVDGGAGLDRLYVNFTGAPLLASVTHNADGSYSGTFSDGLGERVDFTGIESFTLVGGDGADHIDGGDGSDVLDGGAGDDVLSGGLGDDILLGEAGSDVLVGGLGNDVYYVDDARNVVVEQPGEGYDEVDSSLATYTLPDNVEVLAASTQTGQTLIGNGLANEIYGWDGNDVIDGAAGADRMVGGAGNDVYAVENTGDAVVEAAGAGTDEVRTTLAAYTLGANLENLTGTSAAGQHLTGNGAANTISGAAGDDVIDGGFGGDTMQGGIGNDTYYVDNAFDVVIEQPGEGTDTVYTTVGDYTAPANVENVTGVVSANIIQRVLRDNALDNLLTGAGDTSFFLLAGNDTVVGTSAFDTVNAYWSDSSRDVSLQVTYDPATKFAGSITDGTVRSVQFTRADFLVLRAGSGADSVKVDYSAATFGGSWTLSLLPFINMQGFDYFADLKTGSGADTITTGTGAFADKVSAGAGNDVISVFNGNDQVDGGSGTDMLHVYWSSLTDDISFAAPLTPDAGGGYDGKLAGPGYSVAFTGIESFDLNGGSGNDVLAAGSGNDTIIGGGGNDAITGGGGTDALDGGDGDDIVTLSGGGTAYGNLGFDRLVVDWSAYTAAITFNANQAGQDVYGNAQMAGSLFLTFNSFERLTLTTGSGNDVITASSGPDIINAGAGNDNVTGGGGDDILDGGTGADTLTGGTGNDVYYVDSLSDVVIENAGEGIDEVRTTIANYVLPGNVEKLTYVGTGDFNFTGGSGNDNVSGNSGNDFFDLTQGGADKASGGGGTDAFSFGAAFGAGDSVDGGAGADTVGIRGDY
ncbi:MAG TPA: calcium-binding protein, partial [Allosphingosinicella sp.]